MSRRIDVRCRNRSPARGGKRRAAGFTYLGLLFLIVVFGLMIALAGSAWSFIDQRDRERELLFVGRAYRDAIDRYRLAHATQAQPYPTTLEQLLGARDGAVVQRYLRRLYFDPMTGQSQWGLLHSRLGGIVGVYSLSRREPLLKVSSNPKDTIDFAGAKTYADWTFSTERPAAPGPGGTGAAAPITGGDQDDEGAARVPLPEVPPSAASD